MSALFREWLTPLTAMCASSQGALGSSQLNDQPWPPSASLPLFVVPERQWNMGHCLIYLLVIGIEIKIGQMNMGFEQNIRYGNKQISFKA